MLSLVVVESTEGGVRVRAAAAVAAAAVEESGVLATGKMRTQPPLRSCRRRRHFAVTPTSVNGSRMFSSMSLLAIAVAVAVEVAVVVGICIANIVRMEGITACYCAHFVLLLRGYHTGHTRTILSL